MIMGTETPSQGNGAAEEDLSLVRVLNALLRHRRLLISLPALFVVAGAVIGVTRHRQYTASAAFVPQRTSSAPSGLGGLAAQFGIAVPGSDAAESPAFYAELIRSRTIMVPTLETKYRLQRDARLQEATLTQLYDLPTRQPAARGEAALRRLRGDLDVSTSRTTDLVRVSASTRWPEVSQQVVARVIKLVNQFNLEARQSRAGAERRFVEGRMTEARAELNRAEGALASFLQRNAQFRSPQLTLEHERLQREVAMRQQVYNSLAESYEKARIDEVRNTPVITVIEEPISPLRPDGRGILRLAVLGLAIGLLLALALVLLFEFFGRTRHAAGEDYRELDRLRGDAIRDLRRPWRLLLPSRATPPHGRT